MIATAASSRIDPRGRPIFCPGCGYDLAGLADTGRCPECGTGYTASTISVGAWGGRTRPGWWSGLLSAACTLVAAWLAVGMWRRGEPLPAGLGVLFALVNGWHLLAWARAMTRWRHETDGLLVVTGEELRFTGSLEAHVVPLEEIASVKLTPRGRVPQLTIRRRRGPWWKMTVSPIRLAIGATADQAGEISDELKRRIRAAGGPLLVVALAVLSLPATAGDPTVAAGVAEEFTAAERRLILQHGREQPLPPSPTNRVADDPAAARLGQFIFFDERLSANGEVSCATCHDPKQGFADGKELAEGMGVGTRHTPTLWNVAYNRWFFWDGRSDTLWSQALQPIERDVEMGSTREAAVALVRDDPDLRRAYENVFGPFSDDVDRVFADIGKTLAAYQRTLVARRSPFDVFLEGLKNEDEEKMNALSPAARRGLRLFVGKGECRLCHSGPNLSDGEFHDIRVPTLDGGPPTDPGRYDGLRKLMRDPFNAAGEYSDEPDGRTARRLERLVRAPDTWGSFKTPSLRNVALSPPYMHLGQFASLHDVLHYYSTLEGATMNDHHQEITLVPRDFTDEEIMDLVAFLDALTDESVDPALMVKPASPVLD